MLKNSTSLSPIVSLAPYEIASVQQVITPALAIYLEMVDSNIQTTLRLLGGNPDRWRPHVKTAKLASVMSQLIDAGVLNFKCATTLELLTVCESGAHDVVVAYPSLGGRAERIKEIALQFPKVRISVLLENESDIEVWSKTGVGAFIDVNPGMNRTGVRQEKVRDIVTLAREIRASGITFRGLHYYDGHLREADLAERQRLAHSGYDQLLQIVDALEREGVRVEEVITAGTPAFPCSLTYPRFQKSIFRHRMSPGTIVYGDTTSLSQLPPEWGYQPAALVVSMVVSHPQPGVITCDAGHKTVSADAGIPNCTVVGHAQFQPLHPSEEHLPIKISASFAAPERGSILYLLPRHVCPTVNNFDHALIVKEHRIVGVAPVSARGREIPIARSQQRTPNQR